MRTGVLSAFGAAVIGLLLVLPAAPASAASPVLGKKGLFNSGSGWGTAHPRKIFNGGSPGGLADKIRWTGWGEKSARGTGVISASKPSGGYYATRVPIQLKASRLARCPNSARRAYTRLIFRAYDRPGGSYGDWGPWTLDLCDATAEPDPCGFVAFAPNSDFGAFQITAWDTPCTTARAVARASRGVTIDEDSGTRYRLKAKGFVCNGFFVEDGLPSVSYTCNRNTAVVTFQRS